MLRAITDMLGRQLILPEAPRRIISLVPSQTELLYDLGLDEEVVGITRFCVHPEAWFRTKARVGGTKQVHADRIAALRPDLIIANKEENVQEQIEVLSALAPVWVSDIQDLDTALEMIRAIGLLTARQEQAESIAAQIKGGFKSLRPLETADKPLSVAYGIWREPWMWAGGDTFISDVIRRAGWENALQRLPRYPAMDLEALRDYGPDVVLLSSEPYPFRERHIAELQLLLPGAKVLLADGELFSWYGSRLLQTPAYLKSLILAVHE